ncbi:MAG: L,D-transpeptidase [Novosphingobium sp.]|nr:L,D-transpeptidase [Novosphingobium sp.]
MRKGLTGLFIVGMLVIGNAPAFAQGSAASSAVEFARQADKLKPGEWVWAEEVSPVGPVLVYVNLERQLATVFRNGVRIAVTTVSSGKRGHETPTGVFTILQKDAKHRSSTYNNAPMPYQQRLTWDGVALHAGGLPGYPESHGCVHLPMTFAAKLFATTDMGGTVIVAGRAGSVASAPRAGVLAPANAKGVGIAHQPLAAGEAFRWQPELAPSGPVSIVISRTDQRVVVLRNGIEIGRARAEVPNDDFASHAYHFSAEADGHGKWIVAALPGHQGEADHVLDPWLASRIRMPEGFHQAISQVIRPGTVVLLTSSSVLPTNSGTRMTILAASK